MARSSSTDPAAPGAFGLAIRSDAGLPGLDAPSAASRRLRHRVIPAAALGEAGLLLGSSGGGSERIDYHECADGILIRAGRYGDHLVGAAGTEVCSVVERADPGLWRGHVLGQALPLAASLQGLEVFHAGAVAVGDGVLALAGPSGAGKSTLIAALVAAGARFFTDDVLAVEHLGGRLVAFPGTTPNGARQALGGGAETVQGERRRLPVLAFLRLAPAAGTTDAEFLDCPTERLLESTFDGVSPGPRRSLRLLEISAALAPLASELRFPAGADPEPVAAAILARLAQRNSCNPVGDKSSRVAGPGADPAGAR